VNSWMGSALKIEEESRAPEPLPEQSSVVYGEELACLKAIAEAGVKWSHTKDLDDTLDRAEWRLIEAVDAYLAIKVRERKEREGR